MSTGTFTMREVCAETGVEAPTLRMWEQRHGFPNPRRLPSGHRRYSPRDVELITRVLRERETGLGLRAAIEKASRWAKTAPAAGGEGSIFAGLRRLHPELGTNLLPKRTLVGVSQAIEDECGAGGEKAMLFASFQYERFYRRSQARWRDLAGPARFAAVLADFEQLREPPDGPVEVPISQHDPIGREWSVICDAPSFAACLSAWERPGQDEVDDMSRAFETFWSVEPALVREASRMFCSIMGREAPEVGERMRPALEEPIDEQAGDRATLTSLTNRMVAYVSGLTPPLPAPHPSAQA